jgi:hypothetical protein
MVFLGLNKAESLSTPLCRNVHHGGMDFHFSCHAGGLCGAGERVEEGGLSALWQTDIPSFINSPLTRVK